MCERRWAFQLEPSASSSSDDGPSASDFVGRSTLPGLLEFTRRVVSVVLFIFNVDAYGSDIARFAIPNEASLLQNTLLNVFVLSYIHIFSELGWIC